MVLSGTPKESTMKSIPWKNYISFRKIVVEDNIGLT